MNWHEYVMDLEFSFQCIRRQILSHSVNWPEICNIFMDHYEKTKTFKTTIIFILSAWEWTRQCECKILNDWKSTEIFVFQSICFRKIISKGPYIGIDFSKIVIIITGNVMIRMGWRGTFLVSQMISREELYLSKKLL